MGHSGSFGQLPHLLIFVTFVCTTCRLSKSEIHLLQNDPVEENLICSISKVEIDFKIAEEKFRETEKKFLSLKQVCSMLLDLLAI